MAAELGKPAPGADTLNIEERAEQALLYLTETDGKAADLKRDAEHAEHKYGAVVDAHFLTISGTVEVRKALARSAEASEAAYLEYLAAQRAFDAVANKRRTEAIVIEWLRSLNANRRQGG